MIKKILGAIFVVATLIFSGCGDSEGESNLDTQQMLDKGEFTSVIAKLDNKVGRSNNDNLALASAYMGQAGVSLPNLVTAISSSTDDNMGNEFINYIKNISIRSTISAFCDIEKAITHYKEIVSDGCMLNSKKIFTDSEKDVCLFLGLSNSAKVAVMVELMAKDVSTLADDTKDDDMKLTASVCAMQYALDGGVDTNVEAECIGNIVQSIDVNFTTIEKLYTPLTVTLDKKYYYLMTEEILATGKKKTIVTKGYCKAEDFSTRYIPKKGEEYIKPNDFYVCPINETEGAIDLAVVDSLVDSFNEAFDSIEVAASDDIKKDMDKFKEDIKDGSSGDDITVHDMIKYLNNNN